MPEGDYLASAYVDALKNTRSALAADKTGQMTEVSVTRKGSNVALIPGFNFHEAGEEFAVGKDGAISVDTKIFPNQKVSAEAVSDRILRFGYEDIAPANYVFVKDKYAFVAKIMIVGQYRDARGRTYEFKDDGWAVFPDRKFKYEIGLDHVLNNYDYYMENRNIWALRRNGKELQIFATADTDDGPEQITSTRATLALKEQ